MRRRPRAAVVAQQIAARFLEAGNYAFAGPLSGPALAQVLPAAESAAQYDAVFDDVGFAGLAVQSVGYEEGAEEPKVHIYVTKGPRRLERDVAVGGTQVPVEVNRIGRVIVRPEAVSAATHRGSVFERNGRIACGSSCAPSGEVYAGTLGALVRKRGEGQALYVLSNNHVLAAGNHIPVGMPILSPANLDSGPGVRAPGEVARHAEICELRSGVPTLVPPGREDVAIARVTNPHHISSWQGDAAGYDTPTGAVAPTFGMSVKKFGRTTGLTTRTLEALINTPFAVPYKCRHFTATVWFQDAWTVKATGEFFALPGDSGSLVVTEDDRAAVGLVFAASPRGEYGIIVPMNHLATLFGGLTLVSRHGI